MRNIVIDLERLKYPNTGLYSFCKDLGRELINKNKDFDLELYLPKGNEALFNTKKYFFTKSIDKFVNPKRNTSWHLTNQLAYTGNLNCNNLLTIHDLNFLIEKKNNPKKIKIYLDKIQKNINKCDYIVCISNFVLNQVTQNFRVENKNISVIYNGCSLTKYPEFSSPKYNPKSNFFFSIGTILKKKNFHVLSALLINNENELIIAGSIIDKNYYSEIISYAKKIGVEKRVHIIGTISEEEKYWYYNNCEAFVFTSLAEGFGLPVIEAMKLGKPVYLSKLNSLPEIGSDLAFYFDGFDPESMLQTLNNSIPTTLDKHFSSKIISHANQFTWEKAAVSYLEKYKEMV